MFNKHTLLLAVLVPGLAGLAACSRNDADDVAAPVTTTAPAAADAMPAQPMPAEPNPPMGTAELSFAEMDKNGDGGVTHDEMSDADMLHQHFSVADADGDNKLSEAEIMKHRADMAAAPAN